MRAPAPLPMKRAKKKPGTLRNPSATADEKKLGQGQGEKAAAPKNTAVFFVVLGIGLVILTGMGIGGVLLLRGGGSAKYVAPADNEYTEFRPQNCGISCKAPKNWSTDWGAGREASRIGPGWGTTGSRSRSARASAAARWLRPRSPCSKKWTPAAAMSPFRREQVHKPKKSVLPRTTKTITNSRLGKFGTVRRGTDLRLLSHGGTVQVNCCRMPDDDV